MTNNRIRVVIAEKMGIKTHPKHDWDERDDRRYYVCTRCRDTIDWHDYKNDAGIFNDPCAGDCPNFPEDLNACHEMEKTLTAMQAVQYRLLLQFNSDGPKAEFRTAESALCHATALQRCEAFLKTLNLWEE